MKKTTFALSMLLAAAPLSSYAKEITATVNGMVCAFCAQGITKKLSSEPGVEKVDVSLEKKTVRIGMKAGNDLDDKKLESIFKDAGDNLEKVERGQ